MSCGEVVVEMVKTLMFRGKWAGVGAAFARSIKREAPILRLLIETNHQREFIYIFNNFPNSSHVLDVCSNLSYNETSPARACEDSV